jgi:hypothetical protein
MTKRQHVGSNWAAKVRRGGAVVAAIGMMGSLAVTASGCDTVAQIEFSGRTFQSIHTSGFTPPASSPANPQSCEGVMVGAGGGDMRLRFVLADNQTRPIQLGGTVDNRAVELTSDSVELGESALMQTGTCDPSAADQCVEDFTCGLAPNIPDEPGNDVCLREDSAFSIADTPEAIDFIAETDEHQVYGLLMEGSGSLTGWNPEGSMGAWDQDGDGVAETPPSNSPVIGEPIATDFRDERFVAADSTRKYWDEAYLVARAESRKTYYGLWSFNTNIDPTSHVANVAANELPWTEESTTVRNAMDDYDDETNRNSRANVYEAMQNLITSQYDSGAMSALGLARPDSVDKQLVVFVDGYDDMRDEGIASINSVIEAAKTNNVRVFIVHLDPKLQEPSRLRDDPDYLADQEPCGSDADCKNFESCTSPRGYAPTTDGNVELPAGVDANETYCVPNRDEFGRTGPIHDYARLACETSGGYMYVPSADALTNNLNWTPLALDGLWEAKLSSGEIRRGRSPTASPLRIHTQLGVTVVGKRQPYQFSQQGSFGTGGDSSSDDFDNRGVIFTADADE